MFGVSLMPSLERFDRLSGVHFFSVCEFITEQNTYVLIVRMRHERKRIVIAYKRNVRKYHIFACSTNAR